MHRNLFPCQPASELRNNFTGISKLVKEGNTVFLTRNGSGDMVVLSMEQYNKHMAMLELYRNLAEGEQDIKNDKTNKNEDVFKEAEKLLK